MTPDELLIALLKTLTEQVKLPEGYAWAPPAAVVAATAIGLLLLLRGARWARGLAALAFLGLGAALGAFMARAIGTPLWPSVAIGGVVAAMVGVALFRFWQALLLAVCCVAVGFSVYYVRTLTPEVENWLSAGAEAGLVTLQPAGTVVGENRPGALTELRHLYAHLAQTVPQFEVTSLTLLLSTGLAGLILGLLVPRLSRALWAASLGTLLAGVGTSALLRQHAPQALDWLILHKHLAWGLVALVWLSSFAVNVASCRPKSPNSTRTQHAPKGTPATA